MEFCLGQWLYMHQDGRLHVRPLAVIFLEVSLTEYEMENLAAVGYYHIPTKIALSVDVVNLRAIKKRRYCRFPPVKNTVTNPPKVTRSNLQ